MKVVAILKVTQQIGPDDYEIQTRTKVFDANTTINTIIMWGRTHLKDCQLHHMTITESD